MESRERVPSVLNLGLGVCRGARASLPYLPGMPREMTAHLLPYTACAARISLSSSSVNGPRFTVGLSWLHHLRVFRRNNENGNKSERLVRKGEGTRGGARGWGGSAFEDQARKRAIPAASRARGCVRGRAHLRRQLLLLRPTNASAIAVQLPGPPCLSICSRSNTSSCVWGWGQ